MAIRLTPGVSYLLRKVAPKVVIPPATLYAMYILIDNFTPHLSPHITRLSAAQIFGSILASIVAWLGISTAYSNFQRKRALQRLNAQPVPVALGRWPGNADILVYLLKSFPDEYPGDVFFKLKEKHGDLYCMQILGAEYVSFSDTSPIRPANDARCKFWTCNPHYIKEILTTQFPNFIKGEVGP